MNQPLIVGAVGHVGCRLAEGLCALGSTPSVLVDDWVRAPRLARLRVRMIDRGVTDREAVTQAMQACDAVFWCEEPAPGGWRHAGPRIERALRSLVGGDRIEPVLECALAAGCPRMVWIAPEAAPSRHAEVTIHAYRVRGLQAVLIRPAMLYGPFCPWTIEVVRALRRGRRPRVGSGPCVYVDHLIDAALAAAGDGAPAGVVVDVADADPPSCADLLDAHVRALAPEGPAMSGAHPAIGFAESMRCTAAWIAWARL